MYADPRTVVQASRRSVVLGCAALLVLRRFARRVLFARLEAPMPRIDLDDRGRARGGEHSRKVDCVLPMRKAPAACVQVVVVDAPHGRIARSDYDGWSHRPCLLCSSCPLRCTIRATRPRSHDGPGTEACVEPCGSLDRERVEFVGRARESTGSGERVGYAATPAADRLPESSCASRVRIVDLIVEAGANSVPAGLEIAITPHDASSRSAGGCKCGPGFHTR